LLITRESKWISQVHQEKDFYGVWKPYACDYVQFTNEQLQTCINNKKIASIETKGASIAGFLAQYLGLRLKNITMYNNSQSAENDGRSITLSTLSLLHKMGAPDDQIVDALVKDRITTTELQEVYWASGFFLSSERGVHSHMSRMNVSNHIANKALEDFGYKMINAFDMSAAFSYDTATQLDGMHIIGPVRQGNGSKDIARLCTMYCNVSLSQSVLVVTPAPTTANENDHYKAISSHVQG
jgi:hypothetical protein